MRSQDLKPQAVIFDFFNTLVEIDIDQPKMHETLTALGYACTLDIENLFNSEAFNGFVTPSGKDYADWRRARVGDLVAFVGVPAVSQRPVVEQLLQIDQSWTVKQISGAERLLTQLRAASLPFAIASNWDYPLEPYLEQANLPTDIPTVLSWQVGVRKPHPEILRRSCALINVPCNRTAYVGDSWTCDVHGALRAGMSPIWITREPEVASEIVETAASIADVVQLLVRN